MVNGDDLDGVLVGGVGGRLVLMLIPFVDDDDDEEETGDEDLMGEFLTRYEGL